MTDKEMLEALQRKFRSRGKFALSYDDELLLRALLMTDITSCYICGSVNIKHNIRSVCAGHGDNPRYLAITCRDCGFGVEGCLDYGGSIRSVIDLYKERCGYIHAHIQRP